MATEIHSTAIVEKSAQIGTDVVIGAYSLIGSNVVIGDNCRIGSHVILEGYTTLGEGCKVSPFASVGSPPQDLKFSGEPSTLTLGCNNVVRESVTLQPGTAHGTMATSIGDGNLFMAYSHVAHDCVVGSYNIFANSASLAGHVSVGSYVVLGGLVGVHQFCRIGDYSMLSGGAMINKDVPPYCIAQGDRCRLRGVNVVALKRAGFSTDDVAEVKKLYRIFAGGSARIERIEQRLAELDGSFAEKPHIKKFLDFLKETTRGITSVTKNESE